MRRLDARTVAFMLIGACTAVAIIVYVSQITVSMYVEGSVIRTTIDSDITRIVLDSNIDTEYLVLTKDMKLNPGIGDYIHLEYNRTLFVTSGYRINQVII